MCTTSEANHTLTPQSHAREYRSYTDSFSLPVSPDRASDPLYEGNPSSCSRCLGCHGRCPARWSHRKCPLYSAVLFEAPSHPAAASPRAHRPLRTHSTVNDDEFISTVARTENLITFHLPDQCRDGTHTVIPRLMSVTVVVLLKVINIQNLKRQRFMFRKALFHDLF